MTALFAVPDKGPLFPVGHISATTGAVELAKDHLGEERGLRFLLDLVDQRHASGDYGDVCDEDKHANGAAVASGERIVSAFEVPCSGCDASPHNRVVWVITEAERTHTTVLLPEEY